MKKIKITRDIDAIRRLKAGEEVLLDGLIYTARDQAHKRLVETAKAGRRLPIELKGAFLYYCGPTATLPGKVIGSCGPTTSSRMDTFTPALLSRGLEAMIGKGARSKEVCAAIKKYKGVYFVTYAGCGALLSKCVRKCRVVAYGDLGPEAIYELEVRDFPLITAVDAKGRSIYG